MIFVDGENLAMRFGEMLKEKGGTLNPSISYVRDVLVWGKNWGNLTQGIPAVMRKYYYTSVGGDVQAITNIERELKSLGIEAPRVFHKEKQSTRTKGVDITLTTDMLLHAARKNYDIAVLVTGDADYIPVIKAIQGEGARVQVWALSNGLSPDLVNAADEHRVLDDYLIGD